MRRLGVGLGATSLGLLALGLLNAARLDSLQPEPTPPGPVPVDVRQAVDRLSRALTISTVSFDDRQQTDSTAFLALHAFLKDAYPLVHRYLNHEAVANLSLLYTWRGLEPTLAPIVLMGHLDVVPVEPGTEREWTHPPFSGAVADGFIWGRGALDNKSGVLAVFEAVELLLAQGFRPRHTVHLAFGHDEEIGGHGANAIRNTLAARGVTDFALVLDEGGAIVPGTTLGLTTPIAFVGIAEKGILTLELRVNAGGGHSSSPRPETAIGILSHAVARLEDNPFPVRLDGVVGHTLKYLAPETPLGTRFILANLWLFRPLVARALARTPAGAALVRTTTAPTILSAGTKANVLPSEAVALINFRILPGETRDTVVASARAAVDDTRVKIQVTTHVHTEPGPMSNPSSPAFRLIAQTVRDVYGADDVVVAPYLTFFATDARYYADTSTNVFRFLGFRFEADATERAHGTDERLAVESYLDGIGFLHRLIQQTDEL